MQATRSSLKPPTWSVITALVLLLGAVGAIGYGIYWMFSAARPEFATTLLAGIGTVIVTIISIVATRYYERQSQIEQSLRETKVPVYESFISFLFTQMFADKLQRQPLSELDMMRFFAQFTQDAVIWASDDVIQEYMTFRLMSGESPEVTQARIWQVERILLAIRKDLGHQNRRLSRGVLLSMFISDSNPPAATPHKD